MRALQETGASHPNGKVATFIIPTVPPPPDILVQEERPLMPSIFQAVLETTKEDLIDIFKKGRKLPITTDWQIEPEIQTNFLLPLNIFKKQWKFDNLCFAMQEMIDRWGIVDKEYDEKTKLHKLYWNYNTLIADVDLAKGEITIKLGDDLEDTLQRVSSVIDALIPPYMRIQEEAGLKYETAQRQLEESNKREHELARSMGFFN